jgi:DNA-binding MurR/RpiR family transcriptional regulator
MTVGPETEFRRVRAAVLALLPALPAAERAVADELLADRGAAAAATVGDFARRAGVSPPTVIRFSRRLGFAGWAQLKIALAAEHGRSTQYGHAPGGGGVLAATLARDAEALRAAAAIVDGPAFDRAAEVIAGARGVLFAGSGGSAALAVHACYRFAALGLAVSAFSDPLTTQLRAGALQPADVLVAISHTGATRTTVEVAERSRARGVAVVVITSFATSPLAEQASVLLATGDHTRPETLELLADRVVPMSVLGGLHTAVAARLPDNPAAPLIIAANLL